MDATVAVGQNACANGPSPCAPPGPVHPRGSTVAITVTIGVTVGGAGAVGPWLSAAHAILLTPQEEMLLARSGAAWSYNPVASAWKGNVIADALSLLALGARTGPGTDGTLADGFRMMDAVETARRFASAVEVGDPVAVPRGCGW